MKLKLIAMAVIIATSQGVYATAGGEDQNTDCNGQGNPTSPCDGGTNENPTNGSVLVNNTNSISNTSDSSSNASSVVNLFDKSVTRINSNNTATGGSSSSNATSGSSSVTINESERVHYSGEYRVKNTPSLGHYAPDPTISCYKTGGVTISLPGFGGAASGGTVDEKCEMREMVRLGLAGDAKSNELANHVIQSELYKYIQKDQKTEATRSEIDERRAYFDHLSSLGG